MDEDEVVRAEERLVEIDEAKANTSLGNTLPICFWKGFNARLLVAGQPPATQSTAQKSWNSCESFSANIVPLCTY